MADNDNKVEGGTKHSTSKFSSIFIKSTDKGAPANAEAPAVVDSQKQEAPMSKHQKPASWIKWNEEVGFDVLDEALSHLEPKIETGPQGITADGLSTDNVTEDNKLSIQHQEGLSNLIVAGSEYWKGKAKPGGREQSTSGAGRSSHEPGHVSDDTDAEPPKLCAEVKFNLPASSFSLVSFFPDSHYAVIIKNGHYYTANLGTEVVDPTPYISYDTLLISDSLVVLAVTEINNDESLLFLTDRFEGKRFRKPSEDKLERLVEDCMGDGSYEFNIGHESFCLISKGKHKEVDPRTGYFAYPSGTFIYNTNGYLVFEEPNGTEILLADAHGCYVGFYLPLVHDTDGIKILLGPDVFINPKRLTQTLMIVTNEETSRQSVLTCSRPMLVELSDLGIKDASQIEVTNGVAMITQEVKGSTCINVFTPKHQRIIIGREIKIDTLAIGNGVYLPTEGVMLLDDGRLLFAREEDDGSVFIRGKRVDLPQQFLEIS
jgi:hypothetical protein